jgi:YVTN family beta-propeller protein
MTTRLLLATAAALALCAASAPMAFAEGQAPAGYKVVKEVALGGPDRWDYVVYDAPSHRVYVAHGDKVSVVDAKDGKMIGEVTGVTGGTHGIGVSNGKVYTDDGEAAQVVVFDPKTLKVLKRIPAKDDADAINVEPKSGHVFVAEGDAKTVTVVDPKTDTVIANIDAGGKVEYVVADDGKVYVNGEEKKEILRIDAKTNTIDARWPIANCASPHGLAIDTAGHRLFATCVNKLMTVVDTTSGAVVASLPIGQGTDAAAFDPVRKRAFSSNGDGTLTVVAENGPNNYAVAETITTRVTGRTMGIDPASGRLFIAAADVDTKAPVTPGPGGRPGRPKLVPGSLKLMFLDPVR